MKISEKGEHGSGRKLHAMRLRAPAFAPARAGVLAVRPLPETFTYGARWIAALAWDGDGTPFARAPTRRHGHVLLAKRRPCIIV
jgi:hypothetical protein